MSDAEDYDITEDERIFMVMGRDEHGDVHLIGTNSSERALAHYMAMVEKGMQKVEGNAAFRNLTPPDGCPN